MYAAEFMLRDYPERLKKQYGLKTLPEQPEALLEAMARSRGFLRQGGIDWHRISELLLHDFRAGKLGLMSLETPAMRPLPEPEPEAEPETEDSSEPTQH